MTKMATSVDSSVGIALVSWFAIGVVICGSRSSCRGCVVGGWVNVVSRNGTFVDTFIGTLLNSVEKILN